MEIDSSNYVQMSDTIDIESSLEKVNLEKMDIWDNLKLSVYSPEHYCGEVCHLKSNYNFSNLNTRSPSKKRKKSVATIVMRFADPRGLIYFKEILEVNFHHFLFNSDSCSSLLMNNL